MEYTSLYSKQFSKMFFENSVATVESSDLLCQFSAAVKPFCPTVLSVDLPLSVGYLTISMSYCPILHQLVESFADLGEVGSEGAIGIVQLGHEHGIGIMIKDVVDAAM